MRVTDLQSADQLVVALTPALEASIERQELEEFPPCTGLILQQRCKP